jgi:hypothetical protein
MDGMTPEQFLTNTRGWKPAVDFRDKVAEKLKHSRVPLELAVELGEAFFQCSQSTYDYIQYVNELASFKVLDRGQLLPMVAQLGKLVRGVRESGNRYETVFRKFDDFSRPALQRDHFDTVYYDTIQGVEIRELLKQVIDEVEVVLQSFSLVSAELSGIPLVDFYEGSIRLQLFLQYFMMNDEFTDEELWSVLFDVYNQVAEMDEEGMEPTPEELAKLEERIKKFKTN